MWLKVVRLRLVWLPVINLKRGDAYDNAMIMDGPKRGARIRIRIRICSDND